MNQVTQVEIQNVKCLESVVIRPGALTVLSGKNGAGKSAVLEAFRSVFSGGHDPGLIRNGTKKASVHVELWLENGRTTIDKTITYKSSTLTVKDAQGRPVESPQRFLEQLATGFAFDPLEFVEASKKERAAFLAQAVPIATTIRDIVETLPHASGCQNTRKPEVEQALATVWPRAGGACDLAALLEVRSAIYEQRTRVNAIAKEAAHTEESLMRTMPPAPDTAPVVYEELEKKRAELFTELLTAKEGVKQWLAQRVDEINAAAAAEKEKTREHAENRLSQIDDAYKPEIEQLTEKIVAARNSIEERTRFEEIQRQITANHAKATEHVHKADTLTVVLEAIDAVKARQLSESKIEGVEIRDGDIFVDNVPFDKLNTAKKYFTAIQLTAPKAGPLRLMICDRAESLDEENWQIFQEAAKESGFQVIAARVTDEEGLNVEAKG